MRHHPGSLCPCSACAPARAEHRHELLRRGWHATRADWYIDLHEAGLPCEQIRSGKAEVYQHTWLSCWVPEWLDIVLDGWMAHNETLLHALVGGQVTLANRLATLARLEGDERDAFVAAVQLGADPAALLDLHGGHNEEER